MELCNFDKKTGRYSLSLSLCIELMARAVGRTTVTDSEKESMLRLGGGLGYKSDIEAIASLALRTTEMLIYEIITSVLEDG